MENPPSNKKTDTRKYSATGNVTMAVVGKLAGVSQVTVSRALSDPSKVSAKTLSRIREAIELTGFVPNALAGALASRRSSLITAIVPSITNIVYSGLLHNFSDSMRAEGYQIMLSESGFDPESEQQLIATHLSRRPDGILLVGVHHTDAARKMLMGSNLPVAEVWDITETPIDFCVGFSHVDAGRTIAQTALEQGHTTAVTVTAGDERAHQRRLAFAQRFIGPADTRVLRVDCAGSASIGAGRRALARAIDDQNLSKGVVFCSSDLLAHGVLIEANARGLQVPQDIAIIGFGDQEFASMIEPPLTTVRVDSAALGRRAAQALHQRIIGETLPSKVIDLGFDVICRRST